MNQKKIWIVVILLSLGVTGGITMWATRKTKNMLYEINQAQDVVKLFPTSPKELEDGMYHYMQQAEEALAKIIEVSADKRTFINTAAAIDALDGLSNFTVFGSVVQAIELTHPDADMRKAAHDAIIKMQEFGVDHMANNVELYQAFKAYAQGNALKEQLNEEQKYFVQKTMDDFKRSGLDLSADKLEAVKKLKKALATLELNFGTNIAQDNRTITVDADGLKGLDADFIATLKKSSDGKYILGIDYPTYFNVMENCSVGQTRKSLMHAMDNRAYPANESILKEMITKRDELAKLLGYASYAHLDLSNQMVQTPERAEQFVRDLLAKAQIKEQQEFNVLKADLPESVKLVDGKLQPWDDMYVRNQYKKKHYQLDEDEIAQYFPMEHAVQGLLDIYQKFFSLRFEIVPVTGAWHEDVSMIKVFDANNQLLGYFLLDLYPRDNKYTHACHTTLVPSTYIDGKINPAASLVIANFPKSTATKPSLLKRKDVSTFFHEFGHALHALLGRTQLASFAGTRVKTDFVELPSQMLEEWLWDTAILKSVSSHYQTNQPLSDELIAKMLALKNFSSGCFVQRQLYLTTLSLDLFKEGAQKDPAALSERLQKVIKKNSMYDPAGHMYASFGHLTEYAAKYYGYMWSKVFALDIFDEIKKQGLLNPVVGQKYVATVIGKGGSKDPNQLLQDFLGREPNQKAFLKDLGLV